MGKYAKELELEVAASMPADLKSSIENLEERIAALHLRRQICRAGIF